MTLRERVHQSIDSLDEDALALVYEHVRLLVRSGTPRSDQTQTPSLDDVLASTSMDKGDWGEQVILDRAERL